MTPTNDPRADLPFLPTTSAPSRTQERLASCVVAVLVGALAITAPFARIPLENTEHLLPAYAAAILLNETITCALLLALFSVQRSRAVLVLAIGYLFAGAMVVPWALTFPGVFAPLGLLDAGLQGTAWIAAARRVGFPLFVLAYALLKDAGPAVRDSYGPAWHTILWSVAGCIAVATASTWLILASGDRLPPFMRDTRNVAALWSYVPAAAVLLYVAGILVLWCRRRSVLDLWLIVVLCTLLIEIVILSYLGAGIRFSAGWWAGRLYGLTSASVVLLALLAETTSLYVRLARSVSAERRAQQARLTAMEALSASIAHEVNQPLASMVTNADAGLRWLGKAPPDVGETHAALTRIVDDGHRAGKIIAGIRTMFGKGARERAPLDVNRIVGEVLDRHRRDAAFGQISVRSALGERLPPVIGNPVQLEQVVSNLVANAIEAMRGVAGRPRVLRVGTELDAAGDVMVSIEDSGPGLDPAHGERMFEPFFTTKSDGMGMGLMFCRSIVEAHGGRLWALDNVPHGAIFRFTLPGNEGGTTTIGLQGPGESTR